MNISEIIEILAPKRKKISLTKLHKDLKKLDADLLFHTLKGKPFPDFYEFRNSLKGNKTLFNISIGLLILNHYAENKVFDVDSVPDDYGWEDSENPYLEKKHCLSKLFKELKNIDIEILNKILNDKPFPDFMKFRKSFVSSDVKFSIYEGLIILKYYSYERIYRFDSKEIHQEKVYRAKNQSYNFETRDRDGLLGVTVPRSKDSKSNKREIKKVRSVWTVKKK
jgi:hypothetical protein